MTKYNEISLHMNRKLIRVNNCGLFCEAGGFYIDPWKPVDTALITHAHSDHARWGMKKYVCVNESIDLLKLRLGNEIQVTGVSYGEAFNVNGVKVSFHPAGHILGSAQIRLEYEGEVAVVTGDYKLEKDRTCPQFELLKCNTFITESTFGLPVYNWEPQEKIFDDINNWWKENQLKGRASLIFGYALGKSQRILSGLDSSAGPIYTHGAVENMNAIYRNNGVDLNPTIQVSMNEKRKDWSDSIIIAPPSANGTPWIRKFGNVSTAFVSGWMQIRGARRRRSVDRGFVMSDHLDWCGLVDTIKETGAENIFITHGYSDIVSRWLSENGYNAKPLPTQYEGETDSE
jgi:putative mRNA 3-end processing factor